MEHTGDDLAPGTIVGSRYRIRKLLGRGGMGAVYEAEHTSLGRVVAIKVLLGDTSEQGEAVARFFQEARSAAAIGHPGIVEVFDLSQPGEAPFLVMERLEGEELRGLLDRARPLSVQTVIPIAVELCDAVGAAHANGIVHRDLKPDNVFLAQRGARSVVKVLDFGIAKLVRPGANLGLTAAGMVFGTPLYMSPEQMRGVEVDARADVYSLGAILFECLAGRPPFEAETMTELVVKVATDPTPRLSELRHDLPHALQSLIERCLEKDPNRRPQNAAQLANELRAPEMRMLPTPAPISQPYSQPHSVLADPGQPGHAMPVTRPGHGGPQGGLSGAPGVHSSAPTSPPSFPMAAPPAPHTSGGSSGMLIIGAVVAAVALIGGAAVAAGIVGFLAFGGASDDVGVNTGPNNGPTGGAPWPPRTGPSNPSGGAPRPPPRPADPPHVQLDRKISPLIRNCADRYSQSGQRAIARYLDWADRETGPTGRERYIRGIPNLIDRDGRRCADAVAESNALPPSRPELERAASVYGAAVSALAPIVGQAHDYYELETYRDDSMARGQALHRQLIPAFDAFEAANQPLRDMLLELETEARTGRIASLENDPAQRPRYLMERFQQQAVVVIRLSHDISVGSDRALRSDTAGEFIAAVEELSTRAQAVSSEPATGNSRWSGYQRQAQSFTAASLRTMRALRDRDRFSRWDARRIGTSSGWMTEGSPDALAQEYNRLVQETRFLFR